MKNTVLIKSCKPGGETTDAVHAERLRIDLNGTWQFQPDPEDVGARDAWAQGAVFDGEILVPGAWQAQGFGEPVGILSHSYSGPAWYRRVVFIPESWLGKAVSLRIGGAHRRARAFVNGLHVGDHNGFSAPFVFDITTAIRFGSENTIAIRIENPATADIDIRPDLQEGELPSGMLNYIANWGGIYGDVTLEAAGPIRLIDVCVTPDPENEVVKFIIRTTGEPDGVVISIPGLVTVAAAACVWETTVHVPIAGARLWSPDDPYLYTATISLRQNGEETDSVVQKIGIRSVTTRDGVLLLNGRPLYLRGFGDDNVEVLSGFPSASEDVHRERLLLAKSFGFNAVRFHSMTPPEAYFRAADEVGILVMAELPAAYTQYFFRHADFLMREMNDVLLAYRNHPSLLSLAFGNETNLTWLKSDDERTILLDQISEFYKAAKAIAPATLILSNDGFDLRPTDMVSISSEPPGDVPTIRHEFGDYYCSLPDISQIDRFAGVITPTWLHEKRQWVEASGLAAGYPAYVRNSQLLQHLGHRFQIEQLRHDPGITGYHYWLIVDYPGGTGEGDSWEEGWFDSFWTAKAATPEQGREINSPVLPLIGAGPGERTFWSDGAAAIDVFLSNYGEDDMRDTPIEWSLFFNNNQLAASGTLKTTALMGEVVRAGSMTIPALIEEGPQRLDLVIESEQSDKRFSNRWTFWAFPRGGLLTQSPMPVCSNIQSTRLPEKYPFIAAATGRLAVDGLLLTEELDSNALSYLKAGGSVWLLTTPEADAQFFPKPGGSQGTVISSHPALDGFPHDGFCDLQFYHLLEGAWYCPLDSWPTDLIPIIGGIRTATSYLSASKELSRFGFVFEARFGAGKLLVTTLRLLDHIDSNQPEAVYLFDRLLRYATGPMFNPKSTINDEQIAVLIK